MSNKWLIFTDDMKWTGVSCPTYENAQEYFVEKEVSGYIMHAEKRVRINKMVIFEETDI